MMTLGVDTGARVPWQAWPEGKGGPGVDVLVTLPRHQSLPLSEQTAGAGEGHAPERWSIWKLLARLFRRQQSTMLPDLARGSRGLDPAVLGESPLSAKRLSIFLSEV